MATLLTTCWFSHCPTLVRRGEQNIGLAKKHIGDGELKNNQNSRRDAELDTFGEVAVASMFATDELCPLLKT